MSHVGGRVVQPLHLAFVVVAAAVLLVLLTS